MIDKIVSFIFGCLVLMGVLTVALYAAAMFWLYIHALWNEVVKPTL